MKKLSKFILLGTYLALLTSSLPLFADVKLVKIPKTAKLHSVVAFDMDGTLIHFANSYEYAFKIGLQAGTNDFWREVNAEKWMQVSIIKKVAEKLLSYHRSLNQRVLLITKRSSYASHPVKKFLKEKLGFIEENIFFEKDGKTERMVSENVGLMYGDADLDMEDAIDAGAIPVRILRKAPVDLSRDDYHPGQFNEEIIIGSDN